MLEVRTADGKTYEVDEAIGALASWMGEPESHPVIQAIDGWCLSARHVVAVRVTERFRQDVVPPAPEKTAPAYAIPNSGYAGAANSPYWQGGAQASTPTCRRDEDEDKD